MALTLAQLQTFKAAINGDANIAAARAAGNHGAIATYYNAAGSGTTARPDISAKEISAAIVWSEFLALSQAQRDGFRTLISLGNVDGTVQSIRDGFVTIFPNGTAPLSLANLAATFNRTPTRFEALYVTGTTPPICAVFGYVVTPTDIATALGS